MSHCLSQLGTSQEFLSVQSTLPTPLGGVRISWHSLCTFSLLMVLRGLSNQLDFGTPAYEIGWCGRVLAHWHRGLHTQATIWGIVSKHGEGLAAEHLDSWQKILEIMYASYGRVRQINHPAYGTWTADFMFRKNEGRAFLGKFPNDPRVPWRHKKREMMAIAGIIPVAKWLAKTKQQSDIGCRLCKRAQEQRGTSTEDLLEETHGHINSAFCDGMATTFTAAHYFIWIHLYASMQAAQTPASKLRFVTHEIESSMNT